MSIKKVLVVLILAFALKEVVAWRMHYFTVACLSAEEAHSLMEKEIDNASYDEQVAFFNEAFGCITQKQTWPEVMVYRALGKHLFYAPWR